MLEPIKETGSPAAMASITANWPEIVRCLEIARSQVGYVDARSSGFQVLLKVTRLA